VPLLAKKALIRLRVTGTFGTINEVVGREVKGVKIEVEVAEVEAIGAKTSHVRTRARSRKIIPRTSC
jgi:hypothetical protein